MREPVLVFLFVLFLNVIHGDLVNLNLDASINVSNEIIPENVSLNFSSLSTLLYFLNSTQPNPSTSYQVNIAPGNYVMDPSPFYMAQNVSFYAAQNVFIAMNYSALNSSSTWNTSSLQVISGGIMTFQNVQFSNMTSTLGNSQWTMTSTSEGILSFINCSFSGVFTTTYPQAWIVNTLSGGTLNMTNCSFSKLQLWFRTDGWNSSLNVMGSIVITNCMGIYSSLGFGEIFTVTNYANSYFERVSFFGTMGNLLRSNNSNVIIISNLQSNYYYVQGLQAPLTFLSNAMIQIQSSTSFQMSNFSYVGTYLKANKFKVKQLLQVNNTNTATLNNGAIVDGLLDRCLQFSMVANINMNGFTLAGGYFSNVFDISNGVVFQGSNFKATAGIFTTSWVNFNNQSTVSITQMSFSGCQGPFINALGNNNITITNLLLSVHDTFGVKGTMGSINFTNFNLSASDCGDACISGFSQVVLRNATISRGSFTNFATPYPGIPSTLSISGSNISASSFSKTIYVASNQSATSLSLSNSTFSQVNCSGMACFSMNGSDSATVFNTTFQGFRSRIFALNGSNSFIDINNSSFLNNNLNSQSLQYSATTGGSVIYSNGSRISPFAVRVQSSFFFNNSANSRYGGCFYFETLSASSQVQLTSNVFLANQANAGGVLFSNTGSVVLQQMQNTFQNNSAVENGPNMATSVSRTSFVSLVDGNGTVLNLNTRSSSFPSSYHIYSGHLFSSLSVSQFDAYGQLINLDLSNSQLIQIAVIPGTFNSSFQPTTDTSQGAILGNSMNLLVGNVTTFNNFQVVAVAPPPITLSHVEGDTSTLLPGNAILPTSVSYPSSFNYTLLLLQVNALGTVLQTLDQIPLSVVSCDQSQHRTQVVLKDSPIPQCIPNLCQFGCVEDQGNCYGTNQCVCQPGYEGAACQLVQGQEDDILLTFQVQMTAGIQINDSTLMVNFMNLLTATYDLGGVQFVFRSYSTEQRGSFVEVDFDVSLFDIQGDNYVQGWQLKEVETLMNSYPVQTPAISLLHATFRPAANNNFYIKSGDGGAIFLYVLIAVNCFLAFIIMAKIWGHRTSIPIKNMLPPVASAMLIGIFLIQLGTLFFIGLPSERSCFLRKAFNDLGYVIFFSCYVMKAYRLHRIFKTMRKYALKDLVTHIIFVGMIPFLLIILTLIISKNPSQPFLSQYSNGYSYWDCQVSNQAIDIIYDVLLAIFEWSIWSVSLFLASKLYKCWSTFAEAATLSCIPYVLCISGLLYYLIVAGANAHPLTVTYARAYMLVLCCLGILLVHFVPRVLILVMYQKLPGDSSILEKRLKLAHKKEQEECGHNEGGGGLQDFEEFTNNIILATPDRPDSGTPLTASPQLISLMEEDVEMKIWDTTMNPFQNWKWHPQRLIVSEMTHLFLPHYNPELCHVLRRLTIVDRSCDIPNSFQLITSRSVYWIKCRDEATFLKLGLFLLRFCRLMDEDIEENLL